MQTRTPLIVASVIIVGGLVAWLALRREGPVEVADGQVLYAEHCGACHGGNLEGQPDWQNRLANGRLPAPPHDETGHTWHHPDQDLFRIVKEGVAAIVPGYETDMPAFGGVLSDDEIRAVLDYIKGTWPEQQRVYQAARTGDRDAADRI